MPFALVIFMTSTLSAVALLGCVVIGLAMLSSRQHRYLSSLLIIGATSSILVCFTISAPLAFFLPQLLPITKNGELALALLFVLTWALATIYGARLGIKAANKLNLKSSWLQPGL